MLSLISKKWVEKFYPYDSKQQQEQLIKEVKFGLVECLIFTILAVIGIGIVVIAHLGR